MSAFESINSSVRKAILAQEGFYKPGSNMHCRVGKVYEPKTCQKGVPCNPVEGHFITECETCNRF
jgi:hypothetical protein